MTAEATHVESIMTISRTDHINESKIPNRTSITKEQIRSDLPCPDIFIIHHRNGPITFDRSINENEQILWFYLINNLNETPSIKMKIRGYHMAFRMTYAHHPSINGQNWLVPTQNLDEIDDFHFCFNFSSYIDPHWQRLRVAPEHAVNNWSIKLLLQAYIRSNDFRKEFICEKQILGWNFDELKKSIKRLIYRAGYRGTIKIDLSSSSDRILAYSSTILARIKHSNCLIRSICFPLLAICQSFNDHRHRYRIFAEYSLLTSMENFLQINTDLLLNAIQDKNYKEYLARTP